MCTANVTTKGKDKEALLVLSIPRRFQAVADVDGGQINEED